MKKIVLYAVLIIAAVFYIAQTSFAESSFFDMDGLVFSGKEVQENLYKGSEGEEVDPIEVKAQEKIYSRGSSLYVGEQTKKQLNLVFPMYINDGAAVRMMSGNETLITSDFAEEPAYEGLIINNGAAFNDDLERADWNEYILVRLSNGIYINTVKMEVKTFLHDRSIPVNSFCYFTPDFIRYYYYDNGKFKSGSIGDVDYDSVITIGGNKLTYYDFLLAIGEIDVETEKNNFITPQEPTQDEEEPKPAEHDKKDNKGQSQQTKPDDNVTEPQQPQQPEKPKPADKVDDVKPADPADPAAPAAPPAAPSVPETPVQPKPPQPGGDLEVKYPDWKMPVVTPGSTLTPGVYTLKTQVKVDDPAGVIVGGITYEICINEGKDVGKVYKRLAVAVEGSEMTDVIISGLKPDYNFTVRGFFKYKDKYGRVQSEVVTFLEPKEFKTKELSELGKIKLEDFNLKEAKFYPNKIELPNVKFRADSDIDAVGSLTQVVIRFTTEGETKKQATLLSSKNLEKLMNMKGIYFVSNSDLKANTEYEVEVACYDRFSNQLEVEGSHTVSRTCKNLPKGKLDIDFPDAKSIGFSLSITNTDNVEYKNMRLVIKDSAGNTVKFNGQDYLRIEPGTKLTIDTPGNNKTYMAYILCDCDINDGKGEREQQILSKAFTTSSISQLGALVITGENKTADVVEGVAYDRAVIGVSLNQKVTNPELPQFVSIVTLTLSNDKETFSVSLSEDELEKFKNVKNGEEILLDTNNFTNGLSSNTTYKVNFTAKAKLNDELIDIKTSCNLKSIKTPRRPVVVEMKNVQGYTGFIEADIRISDVDDVIVGDTAILQVRKEKGLSTVLVGAFRVPKNVSEFYKVRMYQDGTLSSDGKSYTIEGGANYLLRVVAEEANTEAGLKTNYVLEEKELKTAVGVSGKVYLKALTPIEGTGRYTAEMLVNIEDPSQWLGNKTCYVDVYQKTASGSRYLKTRELRYEGTGTGGTPLSFEIEVDGSSIKTNKYEFNLYVKPNETITIPLSSVDFSTEEQIYTISSAQEFIGIKSYDRKYVVICDIEYVNPKNSYTGGPWKQTAVNARVDFQGFTFDLTGHCVFMWQLNKGGSISNMILRNHVDYTETRKVAQNGANDAGVFLHKNYGILSNIKVEYDETEYPFKTGTYWSDTEEHFKIAQDSNNPDSKKYRYGYSPYTTALVATNYNLIENFVVEVKTPFSASYYGAVVVESNNGTLRNGYVYGSDPENNYMADIEVYTNESGAGANTEKRTGAVVGVNNSGASVENVFALANINDMVSNQTYTSIIVGRNGGKLYNSYSVGDVLYDGKARTSYGPAHITNGGQYGNVYYVSGNSYTTAGNLYASIVALRNATWQSNILNKNSRSVQGFDVDDLININCYPQVKYTSPVMPVQDYIPLPFIETTSKVDMVFSDTYVPDPKNELNDKLEPWVEGNQAWDKPDENGKTYQTQVAVLQITDKSARDVYSVDISNLDSEVLATYKDGTGITTVYVKVSNPTACLSAYPINSITFATYAGNAGSTYSFSDRYVNVEYYWRVYNEKSSQDGWNKVNDKPKENFVLMNDLDFTSLSPKSAYIYSLFYGIVDGNGYEIRNVEYDDCLYKTLGYKWVDTGLFRNIQGGVIKNLTLRNLNFEGGEKSGSLAGIANNTQIEDVYAVGCYVVGGANVGGLIGESQNTTLSNCGVSDTKIINTCKRVGSSQQTGGLVGYVNGGMNIVRCFVQNVYIESMLLGHQNTSVGGLTAIVAGSNNSIIGCYATGTIHASADATGGIIGVYSSDNSNVSDTYADMDIYAYNGSTGGLVGRAAKKSPGEEPIGVSFGNITSGVLMEADDDRLDTYSMVCMDSSYIKGVYYADAELTLDKSGKNHASEATDGNISITYSDYVNDGVYNYLSPAYFTIDGEGTLPRLTDKDGNLLPNQQSEYIDAKNALNINMDVQSNGNIMLTSNSEDITLEEIYTDFRYIDDMVKLGPYRGGIFNSFTRDRALSAITIQNAKKTTIEMRTVSVVSYYDLYHINGIRVTKDGKSTFVRIGVPLDIDQEFCDIRSIDDWKSKVMQSYGENFRINGNIDFDGVGLQKNDGTANTLINRLVGTDNDVEGDYTKAAEEGYVSPYFSISNAKLEPNKNAYLNEHGGWQYEHANGLIRGILSECSNLTFKNITVSVQSDRVGVIAVSAGKLSGLIFDGCNINAFDGSNNHDVGMIGVVGGTAEKIYSKNCVVKGSHSAGGIIGMLRARTYNCNARDFIVENATVSTRYDRAAGAVGFIPMGSFEYTVSTGDKRTTLENCKVKKSTVSSGRYHGGGVAGLTECCIIKNSSAENTTIYAKEYEVGGIVGKVNSYTMISNCSVNNVDVSSSKSKAGGIAGALHRDGVEVLKCYVFNSRITTKDSAGGAIGEGEVKKQIYVENCTVVAKNGEAGGISGAISTNDLGSPGNLAGTSPTAEYMQGWVHNTKVYASQKAGGALGSTSKNTGCYIVTDCEVRAYKYVGGIVGRITGSVLLDQCYCSNTFISEMTGEISEQYSITSQNESEFSRFGGIVGETSVGLIRHCLVDHCIIGTEKANYVGGLAGWYSPTAGGNYTNFNVAKNSVVVGNFDVGGLIGVGKMSSYNSNTTKMMKHSYSNCLVVGKTNVGGMAGEINNGPEGTSAGKTVYSPMPYMTEVYYTGAIKSVEDAAAIYGKYQVLGAETLNAELNRVMSLPKYIESPVIEPISGESGNYSWNQLIKSTATLYVPMWAQTELKSYSGATTMAELLNKDKYKAYVSDRKTVNEREKGKPFIFKFETGENKNEIKDYAFSWVMGKSGVFVDRSSQGLMPFAKTNITNSPVLYDSTVLNGEKGVMKNPFTSKTLSLTMKQGVHIPGTPEHDAEIAAMEQMYKAFIDGNGANTLNNLGKTDNGVTFADDSIDWSLSVKAYAVDADKINIEIEPTLYELMKDGGTVTISACMGESTRTLLDSAPADSRTYTLEYDFKENLRLEASFEDDAGTPQSLSVDIYPSSLSSRVMLHNGEGYYITGDGLYKASDQTLIKAGDFVNLAGGKLLDSSGTVYNVNSMEQTGTAGQAQLLDESHALYEFSYDGSRIKTYGTYSIIAGPSGTNISTDKRFYEKNGRLIVIKNNINAVCDGIFAYYEGEDSYEIVLTGGGSLRSFGSVPVLDRLTGFTNSGIGAMASNMNSGGTTLLIERLDGSISGYDILTGAELFRTEAIYKVSLSQYVSDFVTGLFSMKRGGAEQSSREVDSLIAIMEQSKLSLDEVLAMAEQSLGEGASDGDITAEDILAGINGGENGEPNDQPGSEPNDEPGSEPNNEPGSEPNEGTDNVEQDGENGGDAGNAGGENADNIAGNNAGTDDNAMAAGPLAPESIESIGGIQKKKQQYVSVYDAETNSFEIYDTVKLLDNPQEIVSESEKIVDKASLKAMYKALAEKEDNDSKRGMLLYTIVILSIIGIVLGIIGSRVKQKK